MVNKHENQSDRKAKKGKTKVLNLKKETVKDLTEDESKGVKGGLSYSYIIGASKPLPPAPSRSY